MAWERHDGSTMDEKTKYIVLIDDDPDIHAAIRLILDGGSYELACCLTAAEGLEAMHHRAPDLLLLDIMLGHPREGFQLACQIRRDDRLRRVPIIIVSAIGATLGVDYGREYGPDVAPPELFLEKPFDASTLRDMIRYALRSEAAPS